MPADRLARRAAPGAPAFARHWSDAAARRTDAAIHVLGAALAAAGAGALIAVAPGWPFAAYAAAIVALFPASGLFQHGPARWREATIKIDHAAIYLKIAATYGAVAALSQADLGPAAAGPWLLAFGGAILRALGPARMRAASLGIYLAVVLGGLAAIWPALTALSPDAYRLMMLGGAAYLLGLLFHLAEGVRFFRAIWHALVLIASATIYLAIRVELNFGI